MRISIPIAAAGGRSNTRIPLPGVTLNDRIAAYVRACGFTDADIARFRGLMLEGE